MYVNIHLSKDNTKEIVKILIDAYPKALNSTNENGSLILEEIVERGLLSEDMIKLVALENPGSFEIKDGKNLFVTDHIIRSDSSTRDEKLLCIALQPSTKYQDNDNIAIAKVFISHVMQNISVYHKAKWKQHGVVELSSNLKDDDLLIQQFCNLIESAEIEDVKKYISEPVKEKVEAEAAKLHFLPNVHISCVIRRL